MKNKYILLCLILLFESCCKETDNSGYITNKWNEPEETYIILVPTIVSNGNSVRTTVKPYMVFDNEDWCIEVEIRSKDNTIKKIFYVDDVEYDTLNIGEFICMNNRCIKDKNNKKTPQ